MKVGVTSSIVWNISDVTGLDPINVYFQEIGAYEGRIVVECYGQAWSSFWGSMSHPLMTFLRGIDAHYLTSCFMANRKHSRKEEAYLKRIATAVLDAVRKSSAEENN